MIWNFEDVWERDEFVQSKFVRIIEDEKIVEFHYDFG